MNLLRAVAIAGLCAGMIACQPEQAETAKPAATKTIQAPSFTATALDGSVVSTSDLEGKAYIVNFFASWCPPCRAEIPDMVELQSEYEKKGFTFIGVAVNEDEARMQDFIQSNGINYPVVMVDQQIIDAYSRYARGGLRSIPTSFVISADGALSSVVVGAQSKAAFDDLITVALDAGQ
ncbi:TlpA family protein disulfide reductase [Prosthecochloris sp. N3]|uniref:TlpA family protein disulfide reductase n=1 Tax=Prosthecochloris ethylica TaxID=2743976 RepID=A0ABR9XRF1_9CHLB|nr:TlpA disulfide reductase family protein [Prosthecochloris ethylica]MBF0585979.1 TlpA family protein disulfide reductase [Prosthecochloris ethylica]MBF0636621.1 TlpA family protein disulfide reductase [Prosthecochloris ethylica]NUK47253.1 TlpA family protein disulfide reductase [Prosthecochloris ethylica]